MRRFGFVIWLSCALVAATLPPASQAQILTITLIPPELPVYEQPPIPEPGYIWTPGFWAYGPDGYYWVPGTWVEPPDVGLLWTPGYWGWQDGSYSWNAGYWGPHIGFYGGVNYGFGYGGSGYEGGYWNNGVFAYNRTVNNFGSVNITNVYNKTVIVNNNVSRTSFNGGAGGTTARPTAEEQTFAHERHVPPTPGQVLHEKTASTDKSLLASVNHGRPAIAATSKPGEFSGKGVVPAREVKESARPASGPAEPEKKPPGEAGRPPNGATPGRPEANQVKPNEIKPNEAKPNIAKPNAVRPNEAKPRTATPSPPKAAAVKPAPAPRAAARPAPPRPAAARPAPPPRPAAARPAPRPAPPRPAPRPPAPRPHAPPPKKPPPH